MDRCVNCGIDTSRCNALGRRSLNDESTLHVIQQWLAPQTVNNSDYVCQACWDLAQSRYNDEERQLGHHNVCLRCGRPLASARVTHLLHTNSHRELRIYIMLYESGLPIPRAVPEDGRICHTCWVAADRAAVHMISGLSTSSRGIPPEEIQPETQHPITDSKWNGSNTKTLL